MQKSQGMTLIGMLLTMAVVVISGITIMRIVPVYIENFEVTSSIRALNTLPATDFSADPAANAAILRSRLVNQFDVNSIDSILPDQINIEPVGENKFKISLKYQVIKPLIANIKLLFDFKVSEEVKISAQ